MRRLEMSFGIAALIILALGMAWAVGPTLTRPSAVHMCTDARGNRIHVSDANAFPACIEWMAGVYRDHDYPDRARFCDGILAFLVGVLAYVVKKVEPNRRWPMIAACSTPIVLCFMARVLYWKAANSSWYGPYTFYWNTVAGANLLMWGTVGSFGLFLVLLGLSWAPKRERPSPIVIAN